MVIADSKSLRDLGKPPFLGANEPLIIELPGLPPAEAAALTERLNRYRNECGCSLGARCMVAGFAVTFIWFAVADGGFTIKFLWHVPLAFLAAFLGAGLGKFLGIVIARRRLRWELTQLDRALKPHR
jgi:hypothetical protein